MSASTSSDAGRTDAGRRDLRQRLIGFGAALGLDEQAAARLAEAGLNAARAAGDPRQGRLSAFSNMAAAASERQRPPRPADAPVARLVRPAAASGGAAGERAPAGGAAQTARALASLTPGERAALLLVVVEGFRYAEAASALRIEPDAVPALLAQGRARLAARLGMCKPPARPALRLVE